MKRITLTICAAAFLFAACNNESKTDTTVTDTNKTASASSPETAPEEPYVAPDSAAMMKAWMENATPGDMHKVMASTDGTWECDVTHWMTAGAPPSPASKSTASYKTVLNGLYQEGVFKGDMMGMAFEGRSVMGYDNVKKKFVSTWYDNMGSGLMLMDGNYDPATKTFTFAGTATNPLTKKDCNMREIVKIVDDNTQHMELYGPDPMTNKEYKTMEIVMKRKKK
jgi:hypothetical protein